jgi:3-phytase
LALFGTTRFASDLEGVSVHLQPGGQGYVIVSNQQANTFRVFPRAGTPGEPHDYPLIESVRGSTRESNRSDVTAEALL